MFEQFPQFYPPSSEDYDRLWKTGLVVLDTSALLGIYRFPAKGRREFLNALRFFKGRVWIPHQVGMEFQLSRISAHHAEIESTKKLQRQVLDCLEGISIGLEEMAIDKREKPVDLAKLKSQLQEASESTKLLLSQVFDQPELSDQADAIRGEIDEIIGPNVGPAFSQHDLDKLYEDAELRFTRKIPPGFEDASKDKNPARAEHHFAGINYKRKFGDFILWEQLILHCKNADIKAVMFVTADRKSDWAWIEGGRSFGPLPALREEILRRAGVNLFWTYAPASFLPTSQKYTQEVVSEEAVNEVKEAQLLGHDFNAFTPPPWDSSSLLYLSAGDPSNVNYNNSEAFYVLVKRTLESAYGEGNVNFEHSVADFSVTHRGLKFGFELKTDLSPQSGPGQKIADTLARGSFALLSGMFDQYFLYIALPPDSNRTISYVSALQDLVDRAPVTAVFVGSVVNGAWLQLSTVQQRTSTAISAVSSSPPIGQG